MIHLFVVLSVAMCATQSERPSSFASANSAFIPFQDYTRPTRGTTRHVPGLQDTERIETSAVAESVEPPADARAVKASYPRNITPDTRIAPEFGDQFNTPGHGDDVDAPSAHNQKHSGLKRGRNANS
jgi:hypothetical protein